MKTTYSQERLMSILWNLYLRTIDGKSILKYGEFCKEHKVTNALFPILVKHGVLKYSKEVKETKGKRCNVYTWNSIQPNIHMADKLVLEIQKNNKIANQKLKEKKLEQQRLEFEKLTSEPELKEDSNFKTIVPVYEITQTTTDTADFFGAGPDLTKESYVVNVPKENFISNPVTISTDPPKNENMRLSGNHKPKNQKSISIMWGLISIKW